MSVTINHNEQRQHPHPTDPSVRIGLCFYTREELDIMRADGELTDPQYRSCIAHLDTPCVATTVGWRRCPCDACDTTRQEYRDSCGI